ncbi:hypothetical protein ABBQ38_000384 [Trebouxia sp. C0009 RCD-2024]
MQQSLSCLNSEAVAHLKASKHVEAIVAFDKLFKRLDRKHLTHAHLHTCHNNRAAAFLHLQLYDEALQDAEKARKLAEASLKSLSDLETCLLSGLQRYREASLVAAQGLKLDPFNLELKKASEEATRGMLKDLLSGDAAPDCHNTKAESDHHVRDAYNYMTVQTDIAMPKRQIQVVQDTLCQDAWTAAISHTVAAIRGQDMDCRVLDLGLHAMAALDAGAHHVTAVERWLYLSLTCKETLNGFEEDRFKVIYKRPTDLKLQSDVPILCNLLLCDILDEGLLASGIIPVVRHCLENLLTANAHVIPASATVFAQAVEMRTTDVCGLDMSAMNRHRWHPGHTAGIAVADNAFIPLSEAMEVWHFDMLSPPEESHRKSLDVTFTRDGKLNAVVFWYELRLTKDITLSTAPGTKGSGMQSLGPAVQYLAGELSVEQGMVVPLLASHNTVRMRFDIQEAEYLHLAKPDAAFPALHFAMLADHARNEAYQTAIARVVQKKKASAGSAHVLDLGTGSGLLAVMAAKAGADSVVACDIHDSLCGVARQVVASNGVASSVSVVHQDVGLLQRGREVRALGANVAVADIFDAGLVGHNFLNLLELAKKNVLQPGAAVVPCAASLYVMGVHVPPVHVGKYDLSSLDKYRWDKGYETCQLDQLPHTGLTKPCKVFDYFFEGERKGRGRDNIVKLEVAAEGDMNAVAFWFDLHLDEEASICSGPSYVALGGALVPTGQPPALCPLTGAVSASEVPDLAGVAVTADVADAAGAGPGAGAGQGPGAGPETGAGEPATVTADVADAAGAGPGTGAGQRPGAGPEAGQGAPAAATADAGCVDINTTGDVAGEMKSLHQASIEASGDAVTEAVPVAGSTEMASSLASQAPHCIIAGGGSPAAFIAAAAFTGAKTGMLYQMGDEGLGYYADVSSAEVEPSCKAPSVGKEPNGFCSQADVHPQTTDSSHAVSAASTAAWADSVSDGLSSKAPNAEGVMLPSAAVMQSVQQKVEEVRSDGAAWGTKLVETDGGQVKGDGFGREAGGEGKAGHYWGQALQYLDRSVQVVPGKKIMLLARRDGAQIRFSLRAGTGSPVARAPWKEEWGGGASVENPHFQRVHYCELLVQNFLARLRSKRFPSIEEDMAMLQAHCGSLLLDPAVIAEVYHEMVLLEQIHSMPELSQAASMQAVTSCPFKLH